MNELKRFKDKLSLPNSGAKNGSRLGNLLRGVELSDAVNVEQLNGYVKIVETTTSELRTLKTASGLEPGVFYKIEFQTKYNQSVTEAVKTADAETLFLFAVTTSAFETQVLSEDYPKDVIYLDFDNILCEDFVTPRDGKITYRFDPVKNNYTYYDFRNVLYVRYTITAAAQDAWVTLTDYLMGQVISNAGSIYRARRTHTAGADFAVDLAAYEWEDISGLIGQRVWSATNSEIFLGIKGDVATEVERLTFPNFFTENCHIEKYADDQYNNIVMDFATNITVGPGCQNGTFGDGNLGASAYVTVADGNRNFIFSNLLNVEVDSNCMGYAVLTSANNRIGKGNEWFYLYQSSKNTIDIGARSAPASRMVYITGSTYNTIGKGCDKIHLAGSSYNVIGDVCSNIIFPNGCNYNTFKQNCSVITVGVDAILTESNFDQGCATFIFSAGSSTTNCNFGAGNINFTFGEDTSIEHIQTGSDCETLSVGANTLLSIVDLKAKCTNTAIDINCNITNFEIGGGVNDVMIGSGCNVTDYRIGSNCSSIYVGNSCNIFRFKVGDHSSAIDIAASKTITDCEFGQTSSNITITASMTRVNLFGSNDSLEFKNTFTYTNVSICKGFTQKVFTCSLTNVEITIPNTTFQEWNTSISNANISMRDVTDGRLAYWLLTTGVAAATKIVPV